MLGVKKTVVQPIFATLPEFKTLRDQQVPAPKVRERRVTSMEFRFERLKVLFQNLPALDH
jgi:hypothetical protein